MFFHELLQMSKWQHKNITNQTFFFGALLINNNAHAPVYKDYNKNTPYIMYDKILCSSANSYIIGFRNMSWERQMNESSSGKLC